ncbi:dihydroorotate dehydrogenase [Pontitalea aquivivens]|uniref:dihydroorotate dehydrogenase n=1 Tax=Pontitalea aquivivens TaxID=3388663 RepID=UPI003970B2EB
MDDKIAGAGPRMHAQTDPQTDLPEAAFAAARQSPPEPSAAFMARVLAEGLAQQPPARVVAPVQARGPGSGSGVRAQLLAMLGGWRGIGGMATAALTGVWIGFAGMGQLGDIAAGYLGGADALGTVELLPDADVLAMMLDQEG